MVDKPQSVVHHVDVLASTKYRNSLRERPQRERRLGRPLAIANAALADRKVASLPQWCATAGIVPPPPRIRHRRQVASAHCAIHALGDVVLDDLDAGEDVDWPDGEGSDRILGRLIDVLDVLVPLRDHLATLAAALAELMASVGNDGLPGSLAAEPVDPTGGAPPGTAREIVTRPRRVVTCASRRGGEAGHAAGAPHLSIA